MILDEVTAHLDVKTEAIISTAIQRLMKNKIVIIIGIAYKRCIGLLNYMF